MSQARSARVKSAIPGRVLKSMLLVLALVCATGQTPAGRAGSLRPVMAAAPQAQVGDAGGVGIIAFEAGGEIYVMDASGGTPTRIVERKAGSVNMQPALSPDGSRIAFSSNREGGFHIYIVGVDGEGMWRLTDSAENDSEPAWSPDGSRIAFARGFDPTGNGVAVLTCEQTSDILVIQVDGNPHEINLTNGWRGTDPAWSPDGRFIAFTSDRTGNFAIYTMFSDDGRNVKQLTYDDWADADPSWSPDGTQIAYTASLRIIGGTQCGTMPIGGTPTGGGGPGTISGDGGPYIYRIAFDRSWQKLVTETGGAAGPTWSPDGTQIAFVGGSKTESNGVQVYSVDVGTGEARWTQLTAGTSPKSSPSWAHTVVR
jgi:Tol biopolymer transport system component